MFRYLVFTDSDRAGFNDLHDRIMKLKGLPNATTKDWAKPLTHPTSSSHAMPVDESCYPALTDAELEALVTREELAAQSWFPYIHDVPTQPRVPLESERAVSQAPKAEFPIWAQVLVSAFVSLAVSGSLILIHFR